MALVDYSIDTGGSPEDVQRKQKLADALMKQGMDSTAAAGGPGGGWATALNRGLTGALGGYQTGQARQEEQAGRDSVRQQLAAALQGGAKIDPATMITLAGNPWAAPAQTQAVTHVADMQTAAERAAVADKHQALMERLAINADKRASEEKPVVKEVTNPDGSTGFVRINPNGPQGPIEGITPPAAAQPATVTGPDGQPITIPPGVDRKTFVHAVSAATANGLAGKFTETQGKANQFATRMEHAGSTLDKLDEQGTSLKGAALEHIPGGNYLQSNNYQDYKQAQQEFVTALLRRESGAAIAHHEFESYGKQFFPQPGDGPEVIAQKRQARWNALNAMKSEAGPAYKKQEPLTVGSASANVPEAVVVDGYTIRAR
jgi:hypothetical protein